ncbi:glycosyltransferase 87 family protein [Micromonospora sp. NBC_01813]|uniref:glycosyltransferase 87 family protein n=1 Tax=Micromonospora sp. NBC_01813 TaxID=2975988 RepID=UPI002DD80E33|nr:glycosyltransferase 87 family protein [Micromonospora sp. NBC_01813]WSA10702.1 glycosyltransferase 87 family protein [Micromonospora sp. NBC_01813]
MTAPATSPPGAWRWSTDPRLLAGIVAVAAGAAAAALHHGTGMFWGDLGAYRAGAVAAGAGDGELYRAAHHTPDGIALGFTYPPFAAMLLRPLAAVAMPTAVGVWTAASVLALFAVVRCTLRYVDPPRARRGLWVLGALVAALPVFAVAGHLQVGQVGLFLMWIVLVDLVANRGGRWHGVGVGIVAGIKLTPLIFVGYLVLTGRWRAAGIAVTAFAATIGLGFAWRPADSAWFWSGGLLDTSRVTGDPRTILNQSLSGAVARIADDPQPGLTWLTVAALAGAAGMAVAVAYHRAGDELAAVLACAATGLLVSPVSWHHHWVWWVPALLLLVWHARQHRDRGATIAAAASWVILVASTSWVLASPGGWDLHFTGLGLVYSNLYVLLALAGLGAAGWRLYRDRSTAANERRYAVARVDS